MALPILPIAILGGGVAAYFAFSGKANAGESDVARAMKMQRLADLLYEVITKKAKVAAAVVSEAVGLANYFKLPQTAAGIPGGVLPAKEMWPGTKESVAAYMAAYVKSRKAPAPAPKKAAAYKDEPLTIPFPNHLEYRKKAIALDKEGKHTEAKIWHAKTDAINKAIRLSKAPTKALRTGAGILAALTGK